jgi:hypothetical protein
MLEGKLNGYDVMPKRRYACTPQQTPPQRPMTRKVCFSDAQQLHLVAHCAINHNPLRSSQSRCPWNSCSHVSFTPEHCKHFHIPLVQSHILCDKRFQVEDLFATHLASVFVESGPFYDFWFQRIICFWYEFPGERLDDGSRIDAM